MRSRWAVSALFLLLFAHAVAKEEERVCAQPAVPENGHVVFPSSGPLHPGTVIAYKCDVGFVHLGPEKRRCLPDGRWSNAPPICAVNVGEYKPALERAAGGEWTEASGATDGDLEECGTAKGGGAWALDLLQPYHIYAVELLLKAPGRKPEDRTADMSIEILLGSEAFNLDSASVCYSHRGPLASSWQCGSLPTMESWGVEAGSCYHGSRDRLPWESARRKCAAAGAQLLGPLNSRLDRFLKGQLRGRGSPEAESYWIGLLGSTEGVWRWWNGQGLSGFTDWPDDIPPTASGPGAYAVTLSRGENWEWVPSLQTAWNHFLCRSKPLFCASPGVPAQGGVMLSSQTYGIGTTAFYYCNYGFILRGIQSRSCLVNGTWSGFPPACLPVDCGSPAGLRNGDVRLVNGSSSYGSIARHSCSLGYRLQGSPERECQADGTWSTTPPLCLLVACPRPQPLINGTLRLVSNSTGMGAVAQYACKEGLRLVGSRVRHCSEAGQWTPAAPVCFSEGEEVAVAAAAGPGPPQQHPTEWRHQTNLMTGFIVAVVVLLIMIFLILFLLWKKKKLFYDNFSMSTVYATPTMAGSGGGVSNSSDVSSGAGVVGMGKSAPLYAYNNPSLTDSEEVYCAPASLPSPTNGHARSPFPAPADPDPDPNGYNSSQVYYSLAKVSDWRKEEEEARETEASRDGNLTLTQLELPPELLKVEKLPNGNFHLTLPCIRNGGNGPTRPALPFPMGPGSSDNSSSTHSDARSSVPIAPSYAQPRVPPRPRRGRQPPQRPKKFHTMVGMVRKKLSETTSAILDQLGTDGSVAVRPQPRRSPLDISGPFSAFRPPGVSTGSQPDLRTAGRPPASPTPTEILFSFDDAEEEDQAYPTQEPYPSHAQRDCQSGEYAHSPAYTLRPHPEDIYEQLPASTQPPPPHMTNTYC